MSIEELLRGVTQSPMVSKSAGDTPLPLSWTSIASTPLFLKRTSARVIRKDHFISVGSQPPIEVAPASKLFSTSSFTTEQRSTIT